MKKFFAVLVSAGSFILCAENLVVNGDASKGMENWSENQVLLIDEEGNSFFQSVAPGVLCSQIIEVDPAAHYNMSARFKAVDKNKGAQVLFAIRPLDADKKSIPAVCVTFLPDSNMILAAECKASDTVIKVKDASAVKLDKAHIAYVGFDAKADLSDLPNRNLSKGQISKIARNGDLWEITLKKPCGMNYPAGTAVRIHRESAAYMYPVKRIVLKDDAWHLVQGRTYGKAKNGGASSVYFWNGTKYIQLVIVPGRNGMVYFDDVVFEKIVK